MQCAVLGAGAIGGTIAALLDRAGHRVEVTARGTHLRAIQHGGIRLSGAWGEHTAPVRAGTALSRVPQLAILTTKVMDAAETAGENAEFLDGVPLVVVQNGLGGLEEVAAALPHTPLVGALSLIAASLVAPGEITVTTAASTWLGMADATAPGVPARFAAEILGSAIPCEVVSNFEGARWTKLIINQVNALPAITGMSVQDVISEPRLRRLMAQSMAEAARLGLQRGVRFEEVNGVTHDDIRMLATASLREAEFLPLRLRDYLGPVPNPGSTLQSIRRGQTTEIDYLNGAVARLAALSGLDATVNARLRDLVHEVEHSGAFFTPDQVVARF